MKADEASEVIEACEKAIEALEDCKEFESDNVLSRWRERWWQPLGEGGAAIEGLKLVRDRLRERGN